MWQCVSLGKNEQNGVSVIFGATTLDLYSSLFTVNGSNDTIQLNNEKKKQQQSNAIGTHYTQNSLDLTFTYLIT